MCERLSFQISDKPLLYPLTRRMKDRLIEQVLNEEDVRYVVGNGIDHFTLTGRELSNLIAESVQKGIRRSRRKGNLVW